MDFQTLITIFLINQSLILKLPAPCYHVLKGNYPNNYLRKSKRRFLDTAADWIFGAAADSSS